MTFHDEPFHTSARPLSMSCSPTATHCDAATHDTLTSPALVESAGRAMCSFDQDVPSQTSTSGRRKGLLPIWSYPTALQAVAEVHETPYSGLSDECGGAVVSEAVH